MIVLTVAMMMAAGTPVAPVQERRAFGQCLSKFVHDKLEAKLDTGATECVFARQHGESLGLNIESGERLRINTVTGTFTAYRHEVTMTVLDYAFDVRVCFAEDEQFNRNVLGRHGFLDRVRIGVVDYEGQLYLSRHDED